MKYKTDNMIHNGLVCWANILWFHFCLDNLIHFLSTFSHQFLIALIDQAGHMIRALYLLSTWDIGLSDWGLKLLYYDRIW